MAWRNGKYFYSVRLLRYLSENWDSLYADGIEFDEEHATRNLFDIAEFRADFSYAYFSLGQRVRQIIDADLRGVPDLVLEQRGFWEIKKFRRMAYHKMKTFLNGEITDGATIRGY